MHEALLGAGGVEQEWERFSACLLEWVRGRDLGSATTPAAPPSSSSNVPAAVPPESAWEALLRSKTHQRHVKEAHFPALGGKSRGGGDDEHPARAGDAVHVQGVECIWNGAGLKVDNPGRAGA